MVLVLTAAFMGVGVGCLDSMAFASRGGGSVPSSSIEDVLKEHTPELMSIPGVVGAGRGVCSEKPCLVVLVKKKTPELEKKIPGFIDGYPVRLEATGAISTLPDQE